MAGLQIKEFDLAIGSADSCDPSALSAQIVMSAATEIIKSVIKRVLKENRLIRNIPKDGATTMAMFAESRK